MLWSKYYGRNIISFVSGMTQIEFAKDQKTIAAVMYAIAIMGEATKRLSEEFRGQHPYLPWRELASLRDRLVHDYKNIDLDILWDVVSVEIPALLVSLEPLLPKQEE
ncbi:HepT-like ribonuclease domain-containing protein [Trichothermofontia sp.]